jgi:hypothetical protein
MKCPAGRSAIVRAVLAAGLWWAGGGMVSAAVGISTRFADVVLENVQVGRLYNLRAEKNVPYVIKNRGSASARVTVEVLPPQQSELMPGYEAVPDPAWVKVVPNELVLEGNGSGFAELLLQVPDDPRYVGRHFQAVLWAHASGEGMIGVGVKSRLRFSTGAGPQTLEEEKRRKAMMTLDFDFQPQTLFVDGAAPGVRLDLKESQGKSLKMTNRAETPVSFAVQSVPWDGRFSLPEGYEPAPDPSWLVADPGALDLEGLQVKIVRLMLQIPDGPSVKGKKYAFLVRARLASGVEVDSFARVFVTVK